jgi:hypothetical protein
MAASALEKLGHLRMVPLQCSVSGSAVLGIYSVNIGAVGKQQFNQF